MTRQIAWGILGCARISRRGLIPGIHRSASGRLVALASRDLAKAQAWASEFDVPRAYGSYEELLADREIEVVYIPLPNELHKQWTLCAAEAGKHVLCDKPLGLNAAEAEAMVAGCARGGVHLMEGFMWRHHPRTGRVLELLRGGAVGEPHLVRCSFSFTIDPHDWRLDPTRGGGALWDIGCYGVNMCRLIAGAEPRSLAAQARWGPNGVDMSVVAALEFPAGLLGQIDCSFELPYRCSAEILGTEGALEMPLAYLPDEKAELLLRRGDTVEILSVPPANQYAAMVDHFNSALLSGGAIQPPAENGLANMRVLDSLQAAARSAAGARFLRG